MRNLLVKQSVKKYLSQTALNHYLNFLTIVAVLVANIFAADGIAQTSVYPPIEAAVFHIEGGRKMALPVFSFPIKPLQIPSEESGGMEGKLSVGEDKLKTFRNCTYNRIDHSAESCILPTRFIVQHFRMRSTPKQWFDANGATYPTRGGLYFSGAGTTIGFDLGPATEKLVSNGTSGLVLLSDGAGFPLTQEVDTQDWRLWPELEAVLKRWRNETLAKCAGNSSCKKAVRQITKLDDLKGNARMFLLMDGRKLEYLDAIGQVNGINVMTGKPREITDGGLSDQLQNTLSISIWRIVSSTGATQILKIPRHFPANAELNVPDCESQCPGGWDGPPDVFTAHGRTFVFRSYSGGTVSGYAFFELMANELKYLGVYRWGS
jgi:hypothetical protein